MLSFNPSLRPAKVAEAPDARSLIMGVTHKGSFLCEARSFCPVGENTVWVSERSGAMSIRSARTGDVIHCIDPSVRPVFANRMLHVGKYIWAGTTDGRLCVFDIDLMVLQAELISPEVETPQEIYDVVSDGRSVFTCTANCRVDEWDVRTQSYVRSIYMKGPVRGLVLRAGSMYIGDGSGQVIFIDTATNERLATSSDVSISPVTSMLYEATTDTVWVARENCTIDVYTAKELDLIETIRDPTGGKLTTMTSVGGKVWGTGASKAVFIWHAYNRRLIGSVKDHNAFIFMMGKVFVSETARIWTIGNDKKVNIYDGEGFFQPVRGIPTEAEQQTLLHQLVQSLRVQNAALERRLAVADDKLSEKDAEMNRLRLLVGESQTKIHVLENAANTHDEAVHSEFMEKAKAMEELTKASKKAAELTTALSLADKERSDLRGDIVRLQQEISKLRMEAADKGARSVATSAEMGIVSNENDRLKKTIEVKNQEIDAIRDDLRKARDQANEAVHSRNKSDLNQHATQEKMRKMQEETDAARERAANAEGMKRRLEETIMLREKDLKDARGDGATAQAEKRALEQEISALKKKIEEGDERLRKLQDMQLLRSSEMDGLRQDREGLRHQLDHERGSTHDARNNETKLRLQLDEMQRQLESEKANVKALKDQYTIFQFVINSRSELVQHMWSLFNKITDATRVTGALDTTVRDYDPQRPLTSGSAQERLETKREWRVRVVDRSRNAVAALSDCHKQAQYVVCNYFSDYEKMHLGISTSKFQPDSIRPPIVGDELLTKLRDVTLPKQFVSSVPPLTMPSTAYSASALSSSHAAFDHFHNHNVLSSNRSLVNRPASPSGNSRPASAKGLPKPLPAPYSVALGPHHNVSLMQDQFYSASAAAAGYGQQQRPSTAM